MNFLGQAVRGKQRTYGQNNNLRRELDKLSKLLALCTYNDQIKMAVDKSVRQILNVFPSFSVQILQFYDQGRFVRYIEMKKEIAVTYLPTLQLFLMFPPSYPNSPPFFRVVNPNPSDYSLKQMYLAYQSRNDPRSLVLNQLLNEVRTWSPSKSVVNIVIQINEILKSNYPYVRKDQYSQNYQMWGAKPNTGPTAVANNLADKGNINNILANGMGSMISNVQLFDKAKVLHTGLKAKLSKLQSARNYSLKHIQLFDVTQRAIDVQHSYLLAENAKMTEIIDNSSGEIALASLIQPKDQRSQQILQQASSIKARSEVAIFLQEQFIANKISLQDFLKYLKRNEEQKFISKCILQKIISQSHL